MDVTKTTEGYAVQLDENEARRLCAILGALAGPAASGFDRETTDVSFGIFDQLATQVEIANSEPTEDGSLTTTISTLLWEDEIKRPGRLVGQEL